MLYFTTPIFADININSPINFNFRFKVTRSIISEYSFWPKKIVKSSKKSAWSRESNLKSRLFQSSNHLQTFLNWALTTFFPFKSVRFLASSRTPFFLFLAIFVNESSRFPRLPTSSRRFSKCSLLTGR